MRSLPLLDPFVRALRWHRRWFAALFAAIAVLAALNSLSTADPTLVGVLVAARDIPGGAKLTAGDVREERVPPALLAEGTFTDVAGLIGRTVVIRVPERAVLTTSNLRESDGLVAEGKVALPVQFGDTGALGLLQVGTRIDILGAAADGSDYAVVASAVRVAAVPESTGKGPLGGTSPTVVLVEVDSSQAAAIAAAAAVSSVTYALR